jgi:hypothetical protein
MQLNRRLPRPHLLGPIGAVAVVAPFAIAVRYSADFGLAYNGGVEAWASGHPERVFSWMSTPFLAMLMALVARAAPLDLAARAFMVTNLMVWLALLLGVWSAFRGRVSPRWWWATLGAAAIFAPFISNLFWLQFNPLAFGLALGGFALIKRDARVGGLAIGLSLALKPIVILLPAALLLRRDSRTAGLWSVATAAALSVIGLGFLAWRAGDVGVLNPLIALTNFSSKTNKVIYACALQNYSPAALACRLDGGPSPVVIILIAAAVCALGLYLLRRLGDSPGRSWDIFALACMLSPFIGPIGWAQYQLLLAPPMLLLAYQFSEEGAPVFLWINLALIYLMTMLVWDPLESLAGAPVVVLVVSYTVGQFAQYFLLLLWFRWQRARSTVRPARPEQPLPAGVPTG